MINCCNWNGNFSIRTDCPTVQNSSKLNLKIYFALYRILIIYRCNFNSHVVFAPSSSDSYSSGSFTGLTDLLETVGNQTEAQMPAEWAKIKQHLSVIAFLIDAAGKSLLEFL